MARFLFFDDKLINLMLQDEKPCGGSAVQTYGWIRGIMEEGHEVFVMTDIPADRDKSLLKEECHNIELVPMYERNKGVRWLRWLYYRLPYTYKKIRSLKPDYLYLSIPGWTSALFGVICYLLKIKFIQRLSNDNQLDERYLKDHSSTHQFFLYTGLRLSHHILCQNNFQLQLVNEKFPGKSAIKITNPICLKNDGPVGELSSRGYIAWVGIYRHQKNLKRLYEIASILRTEQFFIAGKEGANCDKDTLYYLQKLKDLPNVKFSGFLQRNEILPFLANARFLLNTSYYEGFSNAFLEAWSVGTPVLSSANVNPDSIISKYDLGLIFNDVFDLCAQYARITPELYQLMSDNAMEYVSRYHGYRVLCRKLLSYLSATDKIITANDISLLPMADQTT
jgi:glycosyltransferase involved in cell wall biosynthesis